MAVTRMTKFTGAFNLGNADATIYDPHTQESDLSLQVAQGPAPGGCATIKITANGDEINIPGEWTNIGSDDASTSPGDVNIITVVYCSEEDIRYTVKVVS